MSDPIIIIGAGAAGIGAALECAARGAPYLVLEASDRIGGRAYTAASGLPGAWDHGCHWLHCADVNPLVAWADQLGATYRTAEVANPYQIWTDGAFVGASDVHAYDAAVTAAFDAVERSGRDVPIPEVLPDAGRWTPAVRQILALMAGEDAARVSAAGYADYADTGQNWPVLSGYGAFIGAMAAGLSIRTGITVRAITQRSNGATVITDQGALNASGVIVTVSTGVLASGAIGFGPGPAADLVAKIGDIPCGAYEKVAFAMDVLPPELHGTRFLSIQQAGADLATSFQIIPGAAPMMLCHVAGDTARALTAAGPAALTDYAQGALVQAFGAGISERIVGTATTGWTENPLILGSYSQARPGAAQLRRDLIAADTGCVAFAGEAFSLHWQSTAHGAYQSGRDVAARMTPLS
ncbi:flavin monoamine oxidase family protein [Roseovarius dicentrarchi]|uniref:flavin monoamine oxidase family protein n=1 Tax=Roseovarius dicentrarchi TaxID=2250573 RepID=UPI000DEBD8D1|nr:NAD(P)/FAD-dependent oxidoreductase [Roseovarius dicentrarchi]